MKTVMTGFGIKIAATVVGGFILALLIAECRERRETHDAVIRLEAMQNAQQKHEPSKHDPKKHDDADEAIAPHP